MHSSWCFPVHGTLLHKLVLFQVSSVLLSVFKRYKQTNVSFLAECYTTTPATTEVNIFDTLTSIFVEAFYRQTLVNDTFAPNNLTIDQLNTTLVALIDQLNLITMNGTEYTLSNATNNNATLDAAINATMSFLLSSVPDTGTLICADDLLSTFFEQLHLSLVCSNATTSHHFGFNFSMNTDGKTGKNRNSSHQGLAQRPNTNTFQALLNGTDAVFYSILVAFQLNTEYYYNLLSNITMSNAVCSFLLFTPLFLSLYSY